MRQTTATRQATLAVFAIGAMFWFFARRGLTYYFTDDDIMNLRHSWPAPISTFLYQIVSLAPQAYRPVGLLFYRGMFTLAGLHPAPFHGVCLGLVALNIYLLFLFTREVTGSREVAALAALIGAFHSRMQALYTGASSVYDILCYTFYFTFLVLYIKWRRTDKPRWTLAAVLGFVLLDMLALNAKEMAVTLPVVMAAYEWLYRPPRRRAGWTLLGLVVLLTIIFCLRKVTGETPLTISYRPQYTFSRVLENWQTYIGPLFYARQSVPVIVVFAVWLMLGCAAFLLRSKAFTLACILILLGPIPVCFVDPRGITVLYVPFLSAWPICLAILLRSIPGANGAVLFATVAIGLAVADVCDSSNRFQPVVGKDELVRTLKTDFLRLHPVVPRPGYILFLDDAFGADEFTPVSLLQLLYHDPDLDVMRMKMPDQRASIATTRFDIVVTYKEGHYVDARW